LANGSGLIAVCLNLVSLSDRHTNTELSPILRRTIQKKKKKIFIWLKQY